MDVISDQRAAQVLDSMNQMPTWFIGGALTLGFAAVAGVSGFTASQIFPHAGAIAPALISAFTGACALAIPAGAAFEGIKRLINPEGP